MSETESTNPPADENEFTSDLHPKHRQTLLDVYDKADWLCGTFDDMQYMEVPSHLRSIRDSLRTMLSEQGLLEQHFACEQCEYHEWRSESEYQVSDCPDCGSRLDRLRTRKTDDS